MDIDKFVRKFTWLLQENCFGSLMDIDKFVPHHRRLKSGGSFGSLMDIDKFVQYIGFTFQNTVSVL